MASDRPALMRSPLAVQVVLSLVAAGLLVAAIWLPFWRVELSAPQYPQGLRMVAYGTEVRGDLREINIINHYVGMEHIDTAPAPEMSLFEPTMALLVLLALAAAFHRRLGQLAVAASLVVPFVILVDLQRWLHRFGHSLDPKAPLRVEPFTPWVIGVSTIGNFKSRAMVSWGFLAMVTAAGLLYLGLRYRSRRQGSGERSASGAAASLAMATALAGTTLFVFGLAAAAPSGGSVELDLQELVDAAPRGAALSVPSGVYRGPLRLSGPLSLIAEPGAVIDGGGRGSVVEIGGQGVTFRGFTVRHGGRSVSSEPAGIRVEGSGHVIENNVVEDVYFGIHLAAGGGNLVRGNVVRPGEAGGVRPGHAISLWNQSGSRVVDNRVSDARDGVYLSFADDVEVRGNTVTGCRYGVHSMYSEDSTFVANRLEDNLLGAALMYSDGLVMRCNRILRHRRGATAYGLLLKDIDDLLVERNLIAGNRVGIYGDGTPLGPGHEAVVRDNVIYGNHAALALQSNVALTFHGNQVMANLVDVRPEGRGLSPASRWSDHGRGNHWDSYSGFDADGDGVGDLPHRAEQAVHGLLERSPLVRAFVHTPAVLALERGARLFPLFRPPPLLVDPAPLTSRPRPDALWAVCTEAAR